MTEPTCDDIAKSYGLWGQYIDPHATMTRQEFDDLTVTEKLATIHDIFPWDCECNADPDPEGED